MRIAYLLGEDLANHPGLREKIASQVHAWRDHDHKCFMVMHGSGQVVGPGSEVFAQDPSLTLARRNSGRLGKLWRLRNQYRFVSHALSFIKPDITYCRYMYPFPGLARALRWAGPLVLEINSDDRSEYFTEHVTTGLYNRVYRHRLLNWADGLVFVTGELATSASFVGYTPKRTVIANGIHAENFPFVEDAGNSSPQLCFIGSPGQPWHGLDKLLPLAAGLPECTLHIVGPSESECFGIWHARPANVRFHGYLNGHDSSELISRMDVGISTLALHRNNMNEACPLKVRHYLASGLPVIAGHADPDIGQECDFFLRIPNTETNVSAHLPAIAGFIRRVFRDNAMRKAVRQYALVHMDVSGKEQSRLSFFQRIRDDPP